MATIDPFESPEPDYRRREPVQLSLFLNLDGFEGPIDVLLTLARDQKVDLTQISILQLADQYLRFVQDAQTLNLELAADYLVMAAWLAYLKSRLLLPPDDSDDEEAPSKKKASSPTKNRDRVESFESVSSKEETSKDVDASSSVDVSVLRLRLCVDTLLFCRVSTWSVNRCWGLIRL